MCKTQVYSHQVWLTMFLFSQLYTDKGLPVSYGSDWPSISQVLKNNEDVCYVTSQMMSTVPENHLTQYFRGCNLSDPMSTAQQQLSMRFAGDN